MIENMNTRYTREEFYKAHVARDVRFDGVFFVAVKTTRIYCRPICPARKALLKNLDFYIHAEEAVEAGFRPCLRCRPESAPGSPAWIGTSATVQRAIRLMDSFAKAGTSIKDIAEKLGVGDRWLRALFEEQVGASPQTILLSRKLDIAKNLLENASWSITQIAVSSGFQSLRRFNDAFLKRHQRSPSAFRKERKKESTLTMALSYRPPLDWCSLMAYFKARAIPMVECVDDHTYQRLVRVGNAKGYISASMADNHKIRIQFFIDTPINIVEFAARIKNMFDLDADPMAIEKDLRHDKKLHVFLNKSNGVRLPGCWDGFEIGVRAIIGQKISVKAALTVLTRLVCLCGERQCIDPELPLTHYFPTPKKIMSADLSGIGLTRAKIDALKSLSHALVHEGLILDGTADYGKTCKRLLAIKGIGPWTVEYIAMRALKNPNAFLAGDLEVKKTLKAYDLDPDKWVPWRAYAMVLLLRMEP
jgi:AraC family transcriptional regulator, regulatory protein of adaptative response / DNA-3-methyladenine glycosylase II